jgi:serine phosphatase RsbU (regulator of sigma subunit)
MPGLPFAVGRDVLADGETLVAFTDGVTDARSTTGAVFTEERLLALVEEPAASTTALLHHVLSALEAHAAGVEPFDDISLLAIRRSARS